MLPYVMGFLEFIVSPEGLDYFSLLKELKAGAVACKWVLPNYLANLCEGLIYSQNSRLIHKQSKSHVLGGISYNQ